MARVISDSTRRLCPNCALWQEPERRGFVARVQSGLTRPVSVGVEQGVRQLLEQNAAPKSRTLILSDPHRAREFKYSVAAPLEMVDQLVPWQSAMIYERAYNETRQLDRAQDDGHTYSKMLSRDLQHSMNRSGWATICKRYDSRRSDRDSPSVGS